MTHRALTQVRSGSLQPLEMLNCYKNPTQYLQRTRLRPRSLRLARTAQNIIKCAPFLSQPVVVNVILGRKIAEAFLDKKIWIKREMDEK